MIVPPLTSQYLNCTKNSSLAVAIGYPDLVSIANTTINQTGQAIEGIAIIMLVYLTISLAISAAMNVYNRRIALRGSQSMNRGIDQQCARAALHIAARTAFFAVGRVRSLPWRFFISLAKSLPPLIDWALIRAVWSPHNAAALPRCRHRPGACWAFVAR